MRAHFFICTTMHTHTFVYIYIYTHTHIYIYICIHIFFFQEWDIENYYYEHNGDNSSLQQINYLCDLFVIFWRQNFCVRVNCTKIFWREPVNNFFPFKTKISIRVKYAKYIASRLIRIE